MNVPASAIVAAEGGPNEMLPIMGNKAEARIAIQKVRNTFPRIGIAQPNAFGGTPEGEHFIVVLNGHLPYQNAHNLSLRAEIEHGDLPHQAVL